MAQDDFYRLEVGIDRLLVQNFGVWIAGWRSGSDGGPVTTQLLEDATPVEQTLSVMRAVKEWTGFLIAVDSVITELPFSTYDSIEAQVEIGAARLIPLVLRMSEAQDAWYHTCTLALNWYLEAYGFGHAQTKAVVQNIFSGEFRSWVEPTKEQQLSTARRVGQAVAEVKIPTKAPDSLERWLTVRETPKQQFQHFPSSYPPLRCDGHATYIRGVESDHRMLDALKVCRQWANSTDPLTTAVLKEWQSVVLGRRDVTLRTTDAFAKRGRERYGIEHLPKLERFLAETNDENIAPPWIGAMAYLDICFFHPFEDGNARLARLALDALLFRAGFSLNYVEPVFVVARAADDFRGGTTLSLVVSDLMGRRA